MTMKKLIIAIAVLGTMAHGIVCAESTTNQANGQPVPARRYERGQQEMLAYFGEEPKRSGGYLQVSSIATRRRIA